MPALPSASMTSRSVSAIAGWLASNLTASISSRGAVWDAGAAAAVRPGSMSRSSVLNSRWASASSAPPVPRCARNRATSSRRLCSFIGGSLGAPSGAAAERQTAAGGRRGIPAEQFLPGEFLAEAFALLGELQALGRERNHVGLAVDFDFALQLLVEFGSHSCPLTCCSHAVDGNSKPPPRRDSPHCEPENPT